MASTAAVSAASLAMRRSPTVHNSIASIRSMRKALQPSTSVGFVPTMGALHEGHLSLVKEARIKNDIVVASIFVNPTQFGKGEDLDKYPRQMEADFELLSDMGVDHLFAPDHDMMFGENFATYVDPTGFDDIAEGVSRPGHFRGVATVVTKLFNIIQPTHAYFGQKDAAQCCLIRRIAKDLDMDLEIIVMDTVRETDGLALSSRNAYLTPEERSVASIVYQSLCASRDLYHSSLRLPNTNPNASIPAQLLIEKVKSVLHSEPLVSNVQYVSVDNKDTMRPITDNVTSDGAVISLACQVGK
eukprot:scaffold4363_cov37-Attheya_sp.AAC.1